MFNLGMGEITVILLLALIILGPKRLPELAAGLGKIIRDIRKTTSDVKNEIAIDDTFRKPFEELRDAVTLHPEELKRRDEIKRSVEETRKRVEELEREQQAAAAQGDPAAAGSAADAALAAVESTPAEGAPEPLSVDTSQVPPPPISSTAPPPPPLATVAHEPPHAPPPAPAPRAFPTAPPPGTVSAPRSRLGPPRVTPPISSLASDRSNTTQVLSEEDLLPSLKPPALPVRKSTPPPLPGVVKPPLPPGPKKA